MKKWYERKWNDGKHSVVVNDGIVESETFENGAGRNYVAQPILTGKRINEAELLKMKFKKV